MSELAKVTRSAARGMITLRGDLSASHLKSVVKSVTGHAVPTVWTYAGTSETGVAWMSPDELLLVVPYGNVQGVLASIDKALTGRHYLSVDVSDARAVFSIIGEAAHEVLARLCPVDLHINSFAAGDFRRTRMAQIPAAFWRHESGFEVVCFRSVADYAEGVLSNAAEGAKVGALD